MKIPLLFTVVTLQVVAFQLIWARLNRRLPDLLIGNREVPADIASAIAEFRSNAGRGRIVLGIFFLLAASLMAFILPLDVHQRKIGLAVVSLLSSGTLLAGFFRDVAKIRRLSSALPEPSTRVAGLRPRSISMAYPPVLEAAPILISLATIAGTIWALQKGVAAAGFHPWIRPAVQIFYILFTLGLTTFQVRTGSCLTWRARSFHSSPEEAISLTDRIIRMEVLYLFICRVAMAVLLGIMQLRALRAAMGLTSSPALQFAEWAILIALLGQLIIYLLRHPIRAAKNPMPLDGAHPGNGGTR